MFDVDDAVAATDEPSAPSEVAPVRRRRLATDGDDEE
jgi:hypothetical protein